MCLFVKLLNETECAKDSLKQSLTWLNDMGMYCREAAPHPADSKHCCQGCDFGALLLGLQALPRQAGWQLS